MDIYSRPLSGLSKLQRSTHASMERRRQAEHAEFTATLAAFSEERCSPESYKSAVNEARKWQDSYHAEHPPVMSLDVLLAIYPELKNLHLEHAKKHTCWCVKKCFPDRWHLKGWMPPPQYELVRCIIANGVTHVKIFCHWCNSAFPEALPTRVVNNAKRLRIAHIADQNLKECARCNEVTYTETHHWAPREFFSDADEWPVSELCKSCHRLWHKVMREQMK